MPLRWEFKKKKFRAKHFQDKWKYKNLSTVYLYSKMFIVHCGEWVKIKNWDLHKELKTTRNGKYVNTEDISLTIFLKNNCLKQK